MQPTRLCEESRDNDHRVKLPFPVTVKLVVEIRAGEMMEERKREMMGELKI